MGAAAPRPLFFREAGMPDRVALFVDGAYWEFVTNSEFSRPAIALDKLAERLSAGSDLLRAYYYHCPPYQGDPPTDAERSRYSEWLRYYHRVNTLPRVSFRLGRLEIRGTRSDGSPRFQQKRVDILLAVDLVMHSAKGHISRAVIVAGDSDFVPAIAVAKNEGVAVTLYHGQSCHNDLRLAADESFRIDQDLIDAVRL